MKDVMSLLSQLRRLDIKLDLVDGKLKINAPKGALNDELKAQLAEQKESIIAVLKGLNEKTIEITKAPKELLKEGLPATDSQARFWFLDRFSEGDASFNMPAFLEIRGELDKSILEKSIQLLMSRHDSLRSAFIEKEGKPFIIVNDNIDWHLDVEVIKPETEDDLKKALDAAMHKELATGFHLDQAPLMRIRLLEFQKQYEEQDRRPHYVLLNCIHHIICDAWSIDIIIREISFFYLSLIKHQEKNIKALPFNFSDYAYWQNSEQQQAKREKHVAYWKERLNEAKGLLSFPYDRARPLKPSSQGASFHFSLEKATTKKVDAFCKQHGLTPFMFFMAVYQLLLSKYSKSEDICVGIPIAGRTQQAFENVIGLFLNAIIIRSDCSSELSLENFLTDIKKNTLEAFDHQDLPLDTLIEQLDIDRNFDEVPGVQFGFNFQNAGDNKTLDDLRVTSVANLSIRPVDLHSETSKHDLSLTMGELSGNYHATLEYRSSLLDEESVRMFSEHYLALLENILDASSDISLNDFSLFSQAELKASLGIAVDVDAILPLTASQEGFYLNDLIRSDNQSTLIGTSILVQGHFDIFRWQKSLQALNDQRAVLRMQMIAGKHSLHEVAYQFIPSRQKIDFEIIDGTKWTLEEAQVKARNIIYTPFELHEKPLIRYRVICLSEKSFLLVTSMHHSLMDAVSALQHWVEAQALYQEKNIEADNYLAYLEFADKTIDSKEVLAHWQGYLNQVDAPDYSVHGAKANLAFHRQGKRQLKRLMVEGEEWQAVKQFCRKQGITPAMLYKLVFGYLVNCYCQPDNDFYINEIITGRPAAFSKTLGNCFLIQPYVFREQDFSSEANIEKLFASARQQQKNNRNHAYISQQALKKLLPTSRVGFYYNYLTFMPPEDFLGHEVLFRDWGNEIDDAVEFNPRLGPDGLELNLFYREALFREVNFLETIQHLIRQMLEGNAQFNSFSISPEINGASYLSKVANAAQKSLQKNSLSVVDLFLKHCQERPDAPAILLPAGTISYQQLNEQSAQIANFLKLKGVTSKQCVVLHQEKSPNLIASILATLRIGAHYLPLDPSLPEERKQFIIENSGAAFVLDSEQLKEAHEQEKSIEKILLDSNSAAYIIYTSGSTGLPKGVQVNHGPLVRTYYAWQESFFLSADDRHLQMASVGFDVFAGDWVRVLCSGASMCLVSKTELMDATKLLELIQQHGITIGEFVPAVLRAVLQASEERNQKLSMRMLMVGSDAWYESDQALLQSRVNHDCLLVNSYGVTEAVIDSSYSLVSLASDGEKTEQSVSVSIGKPLANTALYVLNEQQQLLPREVSGELYIAGGDLAEGYVNDEEKTAASFLVDKITNKPNEFIFEGEKARMYRTGDRAVLCENGDLVLLGRIGQQIKIRGYRIELGEIENQISALAEVDECVVLDYQQKDSLNKVLVAYVVFKEGLELSTGDLRTQLARHLPDYMLPQLCVSLKEIPLNANGKLNRKALPKPDFEKANVQQYLAPRTQIEKDILGIWQQVLGLEKLGINDNFFELGGHSLIATQLVSRIQSRFDRQFALKKVFELSTIAQQAEELELLLTKDNQLKAPQVVAVAREALMPVTYAQQRFWFLDQLVPGFFAYNMPFGVRIKGDFNAEAFQQVLTEILKRHESLRSQFVSVDDRVKTKIRPHEVFPLHLVDLSALEEQKKTDEITKLIESNAHKPFHLDKDLLIRCSLAKVSKKEFLILGCMHHIISDGWSVRLLFQEIALLYNAFSQRRPSPLAELKLQYADYAYWEQHWMQGEVLERYTDFWVKTLEGAPEILKLPTDKPRPQVQTFNGKQLALNTSSSFRQRLERFSKNNNVSLFMTLMAAMAVLMSRYTKEKDILIGTPVAGRENQATENIIGLFLNAVIIRNRLEENPNVADYLTQVKEHCLAAFAHQDMPAEILFERVANHRNPQYPAGAQVGLVLQNTANQQNQLNARQFGEHLQGLQAELLGTEQVVSNYDFGFTIVELGSAEKEKSLQIIAEFNTDLYFDETIEKMLTQYVFLLENMMDRPDANIDSLDLFPRENLLRELELDEGIYKDAMPLTAMQSGMFLANKLNPYSREYGVGFSVRIRQALDVDLWTSSLQGLIDTQDVARIVFAEKHKAYLDDVYQLVLKQKQAKVTLLDWSKENKSEEEIEARASQFINAPYNVLKDDLMRVMLIKIRDDYFVGVFGAHHILMDGIAVVAFGVMGAMNYEIVHNGGKAIVHEDKYREYLYLDKESMDAQEVRNYWREQLLNPEKPVEALEYPVKTEVLMDLQHPPEKSKKSLTLDAAHWEAIKLFCKQQRITPALYFKGLYAIILGKYCRSEGNFYIFEILAGRPVGHMNALGCYFQQIPIVLKKELFSFDGHITDVFKSLRQQQKGSKNKQLISVPLQTSMLPTAPVSFMYNFEHYIPDFYFMGKPVEIQEYSNQVNGIVQLLVKTLATSVQLNLQSQQGFFEDHRMLERMEQVSRNILSGVQSISALGLLDDNEKQQQLIHWNQKHYAEYPRNICVHHLIEKCAQEFSEHIALKDSRGEMSYQSLNEEANQLARYLQKQGVKQGDVVGICLPLCKEVSLAILAILKTGAAYLPMDSQYPEERLRYFIDDSKPKLILSLPHLIAALMKENQTELFYSLNSEAHLAFEKTNLELDISSENLIYVLYTSGSTGLPNCTASYHRCEVNLLQWYCGHFSMNEKEKMLVISALGFDLTQKNLMAPLTVGGSITFYDREHYDAQAITGLIQAEQISWMNCAPSAFYPLLEQGEHKALQSLRRVFLGGEAIRFESIADWYQQSECALVNSYGPSECTDISAFHVLEKNRNYESIPIGQANSNVKLYVLDQHRQAMPLGLPGELYVGGEGVGAEYINNPELSARKFFANPFDEGRIYKTGDLVRQLENGDIEYIGRTDFQLKVRGIRIEPGEIEQRINQHKDVSASVVTVDKQGNLIAYLESVSYAEQSQLLIEQVNRNLRQYFSAAMLPTHMMVLEQFPLSPNGKIDRSALPEIEEASKKYFAPETETEKKLALVWQQVLGDVQVSRYDNFFEIGGHSLLAVQLMSKINQVFSVELPLAILFEAQTLDALAIKLDAFSSESWNALVPMQTRANRIMFCIHAVGGEVLAYRDLARQLGNDFSVYGIQAQGLISGQETLSDAKTLIEKYTALIESINPDSDIYLCGQSIGGVFALALAHELKKRGRKIALVALLDTFVPDEKRLELIGIHHLRSALGAFIQIDEQKLAKLSELEQLELLFNQAKDAYLIPQEIQFSEISRRYLVARGNIAMALQLGIATSVDLPVLHVEAKESLSGMFSSEGWQDILKQGCYMQASGNHESILAQENVGIIAQAIRNYPG